MTRSTIFALVAVLVLASADAAPLTTQPNAVGMVLTPCGSGVPLAGGGNGNPAQCGVSSFTNALGADVNMNNTASYFDGPSVAQGSTGTWFASGSASVDDTAGSASLTCKLWDGTTIINAGAVNSNGASAVATIALSGQIVNPAGNIRISCNDSTSINGKILHGVAGSNSAVVTVIRIN